MSIQDAKVLIQSSRVADRTKGLRDLVAILKHNRGKSTLESLNNKSYLALCETLFQCMRDERASWLRSRSRTPKTAALLAQSAEALRHLVTSGVRTIKSSTVEVIIDSILEILPDKHGVPISAILEALIKAIRALLEYPPHVERLTKDCWDATVEFCVGCLSNYLVGSDPQPEDSWESNGISFRARTPIDSHDTAPKASSSDLPARDKTSATGIAHRAEDFVQCLYLLTKASNAPILDKADLILTSLVQMLQRRTGRGGSVALATINNVLDRITLHSIQVTKRTIRALLPVMRIMWLDVASREAILSTLIRTDPHITIMLADSHEETVHADMEALIETMYGDYRRRQENSALQFLEDEHVCFRRVGDSNFRNHPLNTKAFSMKPKHIPAESLWATVYLIARFAFLSDERKRHVSNSPRIDEESASKRFRVTDNLQDYLRHISEPKTNAKRAALQVIAFMVQEGQLSVEYLQLILEKLTSHIPDENPVHATWALIGLAAAAFQPTAKEPKLLSYWLSAWQSASRAITSVSSSRAACHLMCTLLKMHIVPFAAVSETVQTMLLSIELSGPALLTESSSSFLATILQARVVENPTHYTQTAERILSWLVGKWTPSLFTERAYASVGAHHCCAQDVLRLIHTCLDIPYATFPTFPLMIIGPIGQVQVQTSYHMDLAQYLLLGDSKDTSMGQVHDPKRSEAASPGRRPPQLKSRLLEYCLSEAERIEHRWRELIQHFPQNITSDIVRVLTDFCIIVSAVGELARHDDSRALRLLSSADTFIQSFVNFLSRRETDQDKLDAVFESCSRSFPDIRMFTQISTQTFQEAGLHILAIQLSKILSVRRGYRESFQAQEDDFMDIDDRPNSQLTTRASATETDVPRHVLQAEADPASVRASCSAYIQYISSMITSQNDTNPSDVCEDFIDHLASVGEAELLRCGQFLKALLSTPLSLSPKPCFVLLNRLGDALIDPRAREYNTSEVANVIIVDVLIGTTKAWDPAAVDREGQNLFENVQELYAYYVKGMEKIGVRRSIELQKSIATFLHGLLQHQPDFGLNPKIPSVRTCLFELLSQGEIEVKHHIGLRLPDLFEGYVLSEHDKILQDVDDSLPSDDDWIEGIAIRLSVLAMLASRWHTLLRQSVYRIFATAGSVDSAANHAKRCIAEVSKARGLNSPQRLFRLFAPQIVFTWLDRKRNFAEIPFTVFNYTSMTQLLRDIESEAVGQAIMLGLKDEVEYLAQELETTTAGILSRNMGKAGAYTISWDTCKGSARNKADASNAMLLRSLVGENEYIELVQLHFPRILGHILQTMNHEERISKSLDKRPELAVTAKALAEMNSNSHSTQDVDLGIEPSFSAYYLFDQLERLRRRTMAGNGTFWTPSVYTFVMRMLLDRIHPALGSLHARSIIRKVRILVALAGNIAYEGYPLQMTLQSLRPLLTDVQCAEDTLGVIQYLFEHGRPHLRSHLGFMTGIGLSLLISIRVFLGSTLESTTQQSQHVATMNKAQRFHSWLTRYLESYASALVNTHSSSSIKAFKQISTAAAKVRTEGNSFNGSEESKLLLEILDDVRSGRNLLNNTSREVALNLLCQNFQPAPSARDDILGSDANAVEYAAQVWESCQRNGIGDGYLLWAARVLGRSFSAQGRVQRSTHRRQLWSGQERFSKESLGQASRAAIIKQTIDVFYSDNRQEVSLAEDVVRLLISRLSDDSYHDELERTIPEHIGDALKLSLPQGNDRGSPPAPLEHSALPTITESVRTWITNLTISLCQVASHDPILGSLSKLLSGIEAMPERLFPYILHLVLLEDFDSLRTVRRTMSDACMAWFSEVNSSTTSYVRILIEAVLYLRSQPTPKEVTRVDRDKWLELDFLKVAHAAAICGMYRSALLFAETSHEPPTSKNGSRGRKSLASQDSHKISLPLDLQLAIYKNLEEPDSFYGVDRGSSLTSVLDRFDYEGDGIKSLLFRGARLDSQIRRSRAMETPDARGIVKSLISLNMNSVTHSLLSDNQYRDSGEDIVDSTLHTARKLGEWDIKAPETNHSESATLYKAFQGLHYASDASAAKGQLDQQLLSTINYLCGGNVSAISSKSRLRTLGVLNEIDEAITSSDPEQLLDVWDQMKARVKKWMRTGDFDDVRLLLSCRETLFNVLGENARLLESIRARSGIVRNMEVEALVTSSDISRKHGALQESLASVTYLSDIVQPCKAVGLDIEATAQHEVATVLWDQGEAETSIRMRQYLREHADFDSQTTDISLPVLLAKLGHHIAEARLAKPDSIIDDYLEPAVRELRGQHQGSEPGQVFHEFALFCDKQLQSPEAAEDLARIKTVMDRKFQEYQDFQKLSLTDKSRTNREVYKRNAARAKNWYSLDHAEYERLRKAREQFLRQCLENYLLSLQASDEYNNDALRVFSLWLEYADTDLANDAVTAYLSNVPSGKFALLMNQLSSRMQAETSEFQKALLQLVFRICVDHPYHGMHQIFAMQMKVGPITREDAVRSKDEAARSRQRAASQVASMLSNDKLARNTWAKVSRSNKIYHDLAMVKNEADRQGKELTLDRYPESQKMMKEIPSLEVPPATMQIEVRADCNYKSLPYIKGYRNKISIANGLSAPKIIVAIGSDGKPYKQLFKSGNDDLRQDAIMEQVFDQVSRLLKNHTATRLRNLGIRTYKVLPLSTRSGLMEFVQNTIPLHQWVMPAHEKYYPSDWKSDRCRKEIANCQSDQLSTRVKQWQKVAENFHPVMRYFLLERFEDPDEWFERRLAYTRSTAAISILGHVLGLGDRHCHNILLDEKTGEVVHIDLGVSFEAGRVLPVPEVVPFRLTRDLVDAMGYTKTEGVFRRCCEFTMDTLREERESIMTLLNVLRYDPLVNWSVTPTKAKRMQEGQETNQANGARAGTVGPGGTPGPLGAPTPIDPELQESNKKREEQAGEAGRALSVVEKKLSKTLSTRATVNELIQAATDERNLAVLYCGWASYA